MRNVDIIYEIIQKVFIPHSKPYTKITLVPYWECFISASYLKEFFYFTTVYLTSPYIFSCQIDLVPYGNLLHFRSEICCAI